MKNMFRILCICVLHTFTYMKACNTSAGAGITALKTTVS